MEQNGYKKRNVLVATMGDSFWLGNLCDEFPDAWIAGASFAGKVIFPNAQYMGVSDDHHCYFLSCRLTGDEATDDDGAPFTDYGISVCSNLTFTYDAEARKLTTTDYLVINWSTTPWYDVCYYMHPQIQWIDPAAEALPLKQPLLYSFIDYNSDYGYGTMSFDIWPKDVEGNVVDTDCITYSILLNDEPFTFHAADFDDLDEDMTEIPYDWQCINKLYVSGTSHKFYFWSDTKWIEKAAIVAYNNTGGAHVASEPWVLDLHRTSDGILMPVADGKAPADAVRYDLQGRRVGKAGKGVYITQGGRKVVR